MSGVRRHAIDVALVAAAVAAQLTPLPGDWIENGYANGIYAALARTFVPLANAVPFALGDVLLATIVAGFFVSWIVGWRRKRTSRLARLAIIALRSAGALAVIALWFDAAWALNYRRAPIIERVAFDRGRVTDAGVKAFSREIVDGLNATAPLAHAHIDTEAELEQGLAHAFGPVVTRLGDRYDVVVSQPKRTAFDWWFARAGVGGQWDPFVYETLLNARFLPFERPFALAHEWGHVAGFGNESDANLIAALTTLRSPDPFVRYSGLFWTYGFLPDDQRRALPVSALVRTDLAAARARFLQYYNPRIFALQWLVYDKYLRANRVTAGVASYSLFVQVLVGTPLDAQGLPRLRAPRAALMTAAR